MFGISFAEFVVIVVVMVLVIPSDKWPDVARFLAKIVKFIRGIIWKISDVSEKIKTQIDLEKPIDDLIHTTTDDILADFASPRKQPKKTPKTLKNKRVGRKK
jgi:Sec-independent protein translocase protein TatA